MENDEDFQNRLQDICNYGFASISMILGFELGLFEQLSSTPKTSYEIAQASGYRERYVREWLHCMAGSRLIESSEDGKTFWLPESRQKMFSKQSPVMLFSKALPIFAGVYDKIKTCFKPEGPSGTIYSDYKDFFEFMTTLSDADHMQNFITNFLPMVPGMVEKMNNGAIHLDIGCGHGTPSYLVAKSYPKSSSFGVDLDPGAITFAKARALKEQLPNLQYSIVDCQTLPMEWSQKFDYVTSFDSIHDQAFPDKCLAEIYRVLKPGGVFSMVDIDAHSNPHSNKTLKAVSYIYTCSLFHCMPISLQTEGGMGLGTGWGREKAQEMLNNAGFSQVHFHKMTWTNRINYHSISVKDI